MKFFIKKNRNKQVTASLPQPFSMENLKNFIDRFSKNKDMIYLFPDVNQRIKMAKNVFSEIWENADVRVFQLDGNVYFIK